MPEADKPSPPEVTEQAMNEAVERIMKSVDEEYAPEKMSKVDAIDFLERIGVELDGRCEALREEIDNEDDEDEDEEGDDDDEDEDGKSDKA